MPPSCVTALLNCAVRTDSVGRKAARFAAKREPGSACQKTFFDTLADCEKVRKSSNSRLSAYMGTVGRELR